MSSSAKKFFKKIMKTIIPSDIKIVSNERLSPHFQFLTIKGKSLRKAEWFPGQKIKIRMKDDESRSYTPSYWNSEDGVVQTLIYMHGKGLGALWARDAKEASRVSIEGPRKSLKIEADDKNILFFGDETTYGLAHALKKHTQNINYHFYFEAIDTNESKIILERFELGNSLLYSVNQLEKISAEIHTQFNFNKKSRIILSGKQQSIVRLRELLYTAGIPQEAVDKKVYWGWKDDPKGKLKS